MTQPVHDLTPPQAAPAGAPVSVAVHAPEMLPYTPPILVRFGAVGELTSTVGPKGMRDGRRSRRRTGF